MTEGGPAQEASVLRGRVLYLNRADVDAGRVVFYSGSDRLRVLDADSGGVRRPSDVSATGANDVHYPHAAGGTPRSPPSRW